MRVFLSVPFRDKKRKEIMESFDELKAYFNENKEDYGVDFIEPIEFDHNYDDYEEATKYKHPRLYCLSKALEKIANCDMLVCYTPEFEEGLPKNPGCLIESLAAALYIDGVMMFEKSEEEEDE